MKNAAQEIQMTDAMVATITDRINLMLSNPEINAIYQSYPTRDAAQDFIWRAAVSTLLGLTA